MALLLLFVSVCVGCSKAQEASVQKPSVQSDVKKAEGAKQAPKELSETVQKFVTILQDGDAEGFLSIASKEGVAFGIDSDPISYSKIQEQILQKRGVYCLLFDTDCLRKEELREWQKAKHKGNIDAIISYREALRLASSKKINISPEGLFTWKLGLNNHPADSLINTTTFGFALENGRWQLGSVEYP